MLLFDPIDIRALASPFSIGSEVAFNILPLRDVDYFVVNMAALGATVAAAEAQEVDAITRRLPKWCR